MIMPPALREVMWLCIHARCSPRKQASRTRVCADNGPGIDIYRNNRQANAVLFMFHPSSSRWLRLLCVTDPVTVTCFRQVSPSDVSKRVTCANHQVLTTVSAVRTCRGRKMAVYLTACSGCRDGWAATTCRNGHHIVSLLCETYCNYFTLTTVAQVSNYSM